MRIIATLITALAGVLAAPAMAQDIPSRVGRVAYIDGTAAVYNDPDQGWERAYVNSPVTSENSIWTDPGSRAELRVGGTAVRLDQATQLDVARLDEEGLETFVPRGTVAVRVRHYERGRHLVFDTPHARFSLRGDGRYRIDVDPDLEESRITVFVGEARVGSDSGNVRARAGQTVRVFGGASASYVVERAFNDPFDTWASQRDARWVETRSVQYVSPDMTGYEDLDSYGTWSQDPNYGAVWYPTRVASDWAPYRYGRWDYVRPWGWTWIDDSPWGYAPFHYGRWVSVNNRWAWYPGKREVRPVWAPALVAWIGGSNFSVGVSSGPTVGWYPLSPYDRYQPWYNASPTYVNQVNVVVNNYVNAYPQRQQQSVQVRDYNRERGATVVNREAVVDRRPVQAARVQVAPAALAAAAVVTAAAVLPPRKEVVERRVTQRTQEVAKQQPAGPAPRAGQPTVAGPNNAPAARPEFTRRPAVANATPQPAQAAPAPAQRVTAPSASPVARVPARDVQQPTRDAQQPATREAQQPATREAQQPATREPQRPTGQPAREAPPASREARPTRESQEQQQQQERAAAQQQQQQAREAQQKQQQERAAQQQQERAAAQQQQQQAREAQQKQQQERAAQQQQERAAAQQQQQQAREQQSREAQQRQQQERAAAQQQQQQAREAAQKQQQERAAQQQQQQQERAAAQQQQQQAREAQQRQQQERAQQQQQRQPQQPQQQQQQQQQPERAQRTQPPPPPARSREEQAAKEKKDKEDEEKKSRGR